MILAYCISYVNKCSPKSFGKSCVATLKAKMDSPAACASCAIPSADEPNHSAAGATHPHHSASATYRLVYSLQSCCDARFFLKSLLHFSRFLANANFHLVILWIYT